MSDMTREEASQRLKEEIREYEPYKNMYDGAKLDIEALDMAISALSENKGEDRPKGHWIGHREYCENLRVMPSGLGAYEWCSNCDCGIDVREWHKNHYNFCPNCGADMRGKAE